MAVVEEHSNLSPFCRDEKLCRLNRGDAKEGVEERRSSESTNKNRRAVRRHTLQREYGNWRVPRNLEDGIS